MPAAPQVCLRQVTRDRRAGVFVVHTLLQNTAFLRITFKSIHKPAKRFRLFSVQSLFIWYVLMYLYAR